jgi:hypothetical protein
MIALTEKCPVFCRNSFIYKIFRNKSNIEFRIKQIFYKIDKKTILFIY